MAIGHSGAKCIDRIARYDKGICRYCGKPILKGQRYYIGGGTNTTKQAPVHSTLCDQSDVLNNLKLYREGNIAH